MTIMKAVHPIRQPGVNKKDVHWKKYDEYQSAKKKTYKFNINNTVGIATYR